MRIDGACHCGAISFTAEVDPSHVMVCHCSDCQVMSGSAFRVVVAAPFAKLALTGAPRTYVKTAASGNRRAQVFCPTCGTHLYAADADNPTWASIRTGWVRQRALLKPVAQIWQHSELPWLRELPSVPGSPEQQASVLHFPARGQ